MTSKQLLFASLLLVFVPQLSAYSSNRTINMGHRLAVLAPGTLTLGIFGGAIGFQRFLDNQALIEAAATAQSLNVQLKWNGYHTGLYTLWTATPRTMRKMLEAAEQTKSIALKNNNQKLITDANDTINFIKQMQQREADSGKFRLAR